MKTFLAPNVGHEQRQSLAADTGSGVVSAQQTAQQAHRDPQTARPRMNIVTVYDVASLRLEGSPRLVSRVLWEFRGPVHLLRVPQDTIGGSKRAQATVHACRWFILQSVPERGERVPYSSCVRRCCQMPRFKLVSLSCPCVCFHFCLQS
jgi:hypothetical protein